jgi:two-component system, OmpR family, copper resistance phosphate regulon response regulator CusR
MIIVENCIVKVIKEDKKNRRFENHVNQYFQLMKILLVDDDQQLVSFVKLGLEDHDMQVTTVYDGKMAERIATTREFDVIVLDVMLPGINGFELCKRIRHHKVQTPVLMLTSLDSTDDKVTGFDTGADDYLSKPFDFPELLVRIKALHRRSKKGIVDPLIHIADMEIDTAGKKVRRNGKEIRLTATEYKILELLSLHQGKVFERIEIAQDIWGFAFNTGTNVIDVHINALRKKVDQDYTPKLIHTVVGFGYVLSEQPS